MINNTFRCRNNRRLENDNPRERRIGISRARFRTGYFVYRYTADYCNDGYADSFFRFSRVVRVINYQLSRTATRRFDTGKQSPWYIRHFPPFRVLTSHPYIQFAIRSISQIRNCDVEMRILLLILYKS